MAARTYGCMLQFIANSSEFILFYKHFVTFKTGTVDYQYNIQNLKCNINNQHTTKKKKNRYKTRIITHGKLYLQKR